MYIITCHERRGYGGVKYSSTLSLTSALGGKGGQSHAPAALSPWKKGAGLEIGLDGCGKSHLSPVFESRTVQSGKLINQVFFFFTVLCNTDWCDASTFYMVKWAGNFILDDGFSQLLQPCVCKCWKGCRTSVLMVTRSQPELSINVGCTVRIYCSDLKLKTIGQRRRSV